MLLNESSPQKELQNIKIKLFPHQKAVICEMIKLESRSNHNGTLVMKDAVGSGKSYSLLAVILDEKRRIGKTQNLLVVPMNIYKQWIDYIRKFSNELTVASFVDYGSITALYHDTSVLTSADILIVTSVFYHIIAQTVEQINYTFNRVILDEIDSISFFTKVKMPSKVIWLVSATAEMITSTSVFYKKSSAGPNSVQCDQKFIEKSIQLPPINLLLYNCHNTNIHLLNGLINQNELDRVNALDYSDFKFNFIGNAKTITNVKELVQSLFKDYYTELSYLENSTLKYLSQLPPGNPLRILQELKKAAMEWDKGVCPLQSEFARLGQGYPNKLQLQELVAVLIDSGYSEAKTYLPLINGMITSSDRSEDNLVVMIHNNRKRIREVKNKLALIIERIEEKTCPICLDDFDFQENKKVIMICCQNSFCVFCIKEMLLRSDKCPKCRTLIDQDNLFIHEEALVNPETNGGEGNVCEVVIDEEIGKGKEIVTDLSVFQNNQSDKDVVFFEIVKDVMKGDPRLLIFSDYSGTFTMVRKFLQDQNIVFSELDGNQRKIEKVIENYRSGAIPVIIINSLAYGAGLNLPETTDIILMHKSPRKEQFIGRAQRVGRQGSLNVHELLYPDEVI